MPIEEAVERAVTECINEGILVDFLRKNRAEAIEMSLYEYNEELHIKNERRIAFEEGEEKQRQIAEQQRQRAERAEEENKRLREEILRLKSR